MGCRAEVFALAGLLLFGCEDTDGDTADDTAATDSGSAADTTDDATVDPCDASPLTWNTFGDGYMRTWCVPCHSSALAEEDRSGAPVGVDLDTHEDAQTYLERIIARSLSDPPTMPPAGGAEDEEQALLREWLDCGAP